MKETFGKSRALGAQQSGQRGRPRVEVPQLDGRLRQHLGAGRPSRRDVPRQRRLVRRYWRCCLLLTMPAACQPQGVSHCLLLLAAIIGHGSCPLRRRLRRDSGCAWRDGAPHAVAGRGVGTAVTLIGHQACSICACYSLTRSTASHVPPAIHPVCNLMVMKWAQLRGS